MDFSLKNLPSSHGTKQLEMTDPRSLGRTCIRSFSSQPTFDVVEYSDGIIFYLPWTRIIHIFIV